MDDAGLGGRGLAIGGGGTGPILEVVLRGAPCDVRPPAHAPRGRELGRQGGEDAAAGEVQHGFLGPMVHLSCCSVAALFVGK